MSWFDSIKNFLIGKKPSDSLPDYLKNVWANPAPEFLQYLQTGYIPGQTSTSGSSTSSSGTSNTKGLTTNQYINQPFITGDYAPLASLQRDTIFGRLQGGGLPQGYENEGLRNIGHAGEIGARSLEEALTSRGLGGMTGAGQDVLASNLADTQASFLNSLAGLARDNQTQDLGLAQAAIGQFGTGQFGRSQGTNQSTTNTANLSNTSGFNTTPGGFDYNGYGNFFSSLQNLYNQPRSGGILSPELIAKVFGLIGGGGGGGSVVPPYNSAGYGG